MLHSELGNLTASQLVILDCVGSQAPYIFQTAPLPRLDFSLQPPDSCLYERPGLNVHHYWTKSPELMELAVQSRTIEWQVVDR